MPQEPVDLRNLSESTRFKRALTLVVMTLVLPGSAQIAAGSKRAGRFVWRIVAVLLLAGVAVGVLSVVRRGSMLNFLVQPSTLLVIQVLLVLLALGWAALFVDAYRLGRPLMLRRGHRLVTSALNALLALTVVGALLWSSVLINTQRDFVQSVFGGNEKSEADKGRYNVLLLGGDAGKNRFGIRPDSITLASIDANTGRTVLISLPRNLAKVPFPAGTPLNKEFPDGFQWQDCGANCLLNGVYTYAHDHRQLFPGAKDPGVTATRQAVEAITGLKVNYHVMIDILGFVNLINAVGGINLDVGKKVPIGGGSTRIYGYITPGKNKHLDGYHAMWFARSREGSTDYERITRQKCVMTAMLNQLDPKTVLTKFQGLAAASKQIITTDIPVGHLGTFVDLALDSKKLPVSSFSAVPPVIRTGDPDFALIRTRVAQAIARSEALDEAAEKGDQTSTPATTKPKPKPKPKPTSTPSQPTADVNDVASICKAA
jgi:polyisoprenyl-teichoic acid--peptidoglycan teichoic acid transferase